MGDNPNQYYGEATVKGDGEEYEMTDVSFTPAGVVREEALNGRGFTEKKQGGKLSGKLLMNKNTDPEKIFNANDLTLVFSADTGQAWSCPHAWCTGPVEIKTDGLDIEFSFATSEKIS